MNRRFGPAARTRAFVAALLALQLALATFVVFGREAFAVIPPLTLEWARRTVAGIVLIAVVVATGRWARPTRRDLIDAVVPGLLGFGLGRACVMLALSMTSATNVAVIDSSAPAVALALAVVAGRERPGAAALLGSALAFAGVIFLVMAGGGFGVPNAGDAIALGSPLSWGAIYFWIGRRSPDPATLLRRTAWFSLAGAAALTVPALGPGPGVVRLLADPRVLAVLVMGVAIGVVENGLTFRAIAVLGPVPTAELEYLVPVLTAAVGLVTLGTPVLPAQVAAMTLVASGLIVAGRARRHRTTANQALAGQPCCLT